MSTGDKNINKWCQYTREASYTRNISYHRAIKVSPYEAVYGIKPHREKLNEQSNGSHSEQQEENSFEESNEKRSQLQDDEEPPRKRQKIIENQRKYNAAMGNCPHGIEKKKQKHLTGLRNYIRPT